MNFVFFNILGIGPKIRVPIGFPCLLIKATAFSRKKKDEPSFFLYFFLVRTTRALKTSHFETLDVFLDLLRSCWTETTTMSPNLA